MKPMQAIQDRLWQLYRNQDDFRDKEDWQSMLSIPKAPAAVRIAASNLRKMLLSSDNWITAEGLGPVEEAFAPYASKAVNTLMQSSAFRFSQPFIEGLECGLAVGLGVWKIQPEQMNIDAITLGGEQQGGRQITLRARAVDYRKFKYGKYSNAERFDWTIEDWEIPFALLAEREDINPEVLAKIQRDSFSTPTEEDKDPERFDLTQATIARKSQINNVGVREYFGDVYDIRTQRVVARNQHILVLNRKFIGFIKENEFWHKRPNYVAFSPRHIAFRFPGAGILEESRDLFRAVNKLANLEIDGLEYSMLKQFEADLSLLENPEDIATGIEPGKIYRKRQGTNVLPAIREIPVSDSKRGGIEMQVFLDRSIQQGTAQSDILQGLTPESNPTATEVQQRVAGSNSLTLSMALDIEEQALSPMAQMIFWNALQFLDSTTQPSWSRLLGAEVEVDQWTPEMRMQIIGGNYEFKFVGLSEAIRRQERQQKILETLKIISPSPILTAMVNMPSLIKDLLESIGTGSYLNPNADQIFQMMTMQQAQAQAQAQEAEAEAMEQQFEMRNESAMKRDAFKQGLMKDAETFKAGLKLATQPKEKKNGR